MRHPFPFRHFARLALAAAVLVGASAASAHATGPIADRWEARGDRVDQRLDTRGDHAEARLALAVYHAEIVSKVGGLIAGMTYGAKASEAEKQLAAALKLTPKSPVAHLEQGNVALLLHGAKGEEAAAAAYERAASLKPRDAMEWLDARHAASQIE